MKAILIKKKKACCYQRQSNLFVRSFVAMATTLSLRLHLYGTKYPCLDNSTCCLLMHLCTTQLSAAHKLQLTAHSSLTAPDFTKDPAGSSGVAPHNAQGGIVIPPCSGCKTKGCPYPRCPSTLNCTVASQPTTFGAAFGAGLEAATGIPRRVGVAKVGL